MDNSESAFPGIRYVKRPGINEPITEVHVSGLTKREWFAGMALMGMCANPDISRGAAILNMTAETLRISLADSAYKCADAMILASTQREGEKGQDDEAKRNNEAR